MKRVFVFVKSWVVIGFFLGSVGAEDIATYRKNPQETTTAKNMTHTAAQTSTSAYHQPQGDTKANSPMEEGELGTETRNLSEQVREKMLVGPDLHPKIASLLASRSKQLPQLPQTRNSGQMELTCVSPSVLDIEDMKKGFPNISSLTVKQMDFSNASIYAAFKDLISSRTINHLSLANSNLSDEQLKDLVASLRDLRELNLSGTKITNAGVAHLGSLTNLEILDLSDTEITDVGLLPLAYLENLRKLFLGNKSISYLYISMFLGANPNLNIYGGEAVW